MQRSIVRAQMGTPLVRRAAADGHRRSGPSSDGSTLSPDEQRQVIDTFVDLLEGLYTHLPLKRARYAIDPLQRLRLLRQRVTALDDAALHEELARTMTSLRDAHTRYIGPSSLEGQVATLPFLVEAYGDLGRRRYIVSKVAEGRVGISDRHFLAGVELLHWNAVPIDRAIDVHAERETGGRPDARRRRACESLTSRALRYGPPPDEDWVVVRYRGLDDRIRETRFDWRLVSPGRASTAAPRGGARRVVAADPAAEMVRRVKKLMFAPELWAADHADRPRAGHRGTVPAGDDWLPTDYQDAVAAKEITTRHGRFGYLRLWSFDVADDVEYVGEVVRLLSLLPQKGLVVDLRGNPGGLVWAAERLLQLFTPRTVVPARFSMVATALTRAMASAPQNAAELEPWAESLDAALANGDLYSHAAPITPPPLANDIGQVYSGPVVAVVDANTYSAGDLFAAGFADNEIGPLVCVDQATGGGGANVWTPDDVEDALAGTRFGPQRLPAGIGYTIAVRRATRSGVAEGVAIEDVGVAGQLHYTMTKRDLTGGNAGLLRFCTDLLNDEPPTVMHVEPSPGDALTLLVATTGLDRLDVTVDGRPTAPLDLPRRGTSTVTLTDPVDTVELEGYAAGRLRQRRILHPVP